MTSLSNISNRGIVTVAGDEAQDWLQDLVTGDLKQLAPGQAVYSCLLTPQGKFLHDFLITQRENTLFLECEAARAGDLARLLKMYALRAKVTIADAVSEYRIYAAWGYDNTVQLPFSDAWYRDPRHEKLGFRAVLPQDKDIETGAAFDDYDLHRIRLGIPDGSCDLAVKLSTILDYNIDLLHGVSWKKGCYVGQEVTARMHYRGLLKKRLFPVKSANNTPLPPAGTAVTVEEDGKKAGEIRSSCGAEGLALLKLAVLEQGLVADGVSLTLSVPEYLKRL
ncbi:MAG: folate-binding protein YgfZ [Pseudomonadota bacterium]|nr:folate-binding protein [Pseudomonadota bacterium]QKK05044.1 MAG: folate-binding protein YgfZ [Pseudomonadota bacterium]